MKANIAGILILLSLIFLVVPQGARAYNPVEGALIAFPIYYGIAPFIVGLIAGYFFRKARPDKPVKTKMAIILIVIGISMPFIIGDLFFPTSGVISLFGPPLILNGLLGFFSAWWKTKVKATFLLSSIPLSFVMFLLLSASISASYSIDNLAKTGATPPAGFAEIASYYKIQNPVSIDNKLAYTAWNYSDIFIVYDGKEIGNAYCSNIQRNDIKEAMCGWFAFNGSLCHVIDARIEQFTPKEVIMCDGQEIGSEYDHVSDPVVIDGKLAFIAWKNRTRFIVFDGKEMGKEYDSVGYLVGINGKLTYAGARNNRSFIVYDTNELEQQYNEVYSPFEFNGKLAYVARNGGKSFIIYDGKEIGKEYYNIDGPKEINGKITFIANEGNEIFIVYGDREIGREYYDVSFPFGINGKLGFVGKKDNSPSSKEFLVLEQ